jgi:hypothetical protein
MCDLSPVCNESKTTFATSGTGTAYPSGAPGAFSPVFSWVIVVQSFLFRVDTCIYRCLPISPFSFDHFIVSSIYGFWLPLWYLQTFRSMFIKFRTILFVMNIQYCIACNDFKYYLIIILNQTFVSFYFRICQNDVTLIWR